jgi:hypothetical protein
MSGWGWEIRIGGRNPNFKTTITMKTTTLNTLRTAILAALLSSAALVSAHAAPDAALSAMSLTGSVAVKEAGPYVQVGSYRIWVSSHLGKPSLVLADGTWLYSHFTVDGSGAAGTLLVRFNRGQVSEMKLVSPAIVAALRSAPKASGALVAISHR